MRAFLYGILHLYATPSVSVHLNTAMTYYKLEEAIEMAVQNRFDEHPIHGSVYYQSYYHT